ncbi:hypothetical protein JAAARDRAFT_141333 [Jaapia argillacea MUCL 33604]|uniref:Fungal pheromone STE3G-protein-coupled receptor n=1 Tax=Jaapia argillacea MUCL 33604 TaxID=933084 RepID=A0A067P798_9AGAM|nr:hypothetical protein JAAARDRAFT_141333 [Jaapia argillacea MUCL 33604]
MGVSSTVNLAYTVFAFFGFVLAAVPIYWQLEVWNVGACSYLAWTAIQCLIVFVNTIVWRDNVINWAPVWCDISTKITIGTGIALQAASLCINRRLYLISKSPAAGVGSGSGRRRIIMADLSICLGIPLVFMILHYICQGHRFNIFEGLGCTASTYFTPVTWAIFVPWPIVVSLISSIYGGLTIYRFSRIEKTFDELRGQRTSLTKRRYLRLMTIASGEIVCGLPILLFNLAITTQSPTYPWISWEDTHYNFSRVIQVPAVEWRSVGELFVFVKTSLLLPPLAAVLFVVFSGLVGDAVRNYRVPLDFVANRCCFWRKVVPTPYVFLIHLF